MRILPTVLAALLLASTGCSGGDDDDDDGPTAPVVNDVTPGTGIVGTEVTITGQRFGDEQGTSTVTFDGIAADVTSWSDTQLVVAVPPDAYPGTRPVVVSVDGEATSPFAFAVVLPDAVYGNNDSTPTSVTAFTTSSGAFTPTVYVVDSGGSTGYGGDSSAIFVHAPTRRLFSSHRGFIAVFDIDPVTGLLAEVAGSPFATGGSGLYGVEVNAAGDVVYAAECGATDAVVAMSVAADGTLAHLPGSPHAYVTGNCIDVVRLTPDGSFLVASVEDGTVRVYSVDGSGALTEVSGSPFSFANNGGNYGFDMHPTRNAFYLPSLSNNALYVYSVTAGTGAPLLLNSAMGLGQVDTSSFAFTDDGNRLFTLNSEDDQLFAFDVDGTGAITLVSGSPFTISAPSNAIEITGTTMWAGGTDGLLYRHTIATTGAPTASGTPVPNPNGGGSINALAAP